MVITTTVQHSFTILLFSLLVLVLALVLVIVLVLAAVV